VPDGFALVTRLEQINADGTPKPGDQRWVSGIQPLRRFSLGEYLAALFGVQRGFYRVIAFVVTSYPFVQSEATLSEQQAEDWLAYGSNTLPLPIGALPYTADYACTALIHEFQQPGNGHSVELDIPSLIAGQVHLARATIWPALEEHARPTP